MIVASSSTALPHDKVHIQICILSSAYYTRDAAHTRGKFGNERRCTHKARADHRHVLCVERTYVCCCTRCCLPYLTLPLDRRIRDRVLISDGRLVVSRVSVFVEVVRVHTLLSVSVVSALCLSIIAPNRAVSNRPTRLCRRRRCRIHPTRQTSNTRRNRARRVRLALSVL